jgi:hypothetical protein
VGENPEVTVSARRRAVVPFVPLAVALLALTGCGGMDLGPGDGAASPSPSADTDAPSASPTPSGSVSPTATPTTGPTGTASPVAIPTDCREIVSASAYESVFADVPLNPEGFTTRSGAPFGQVTPTTPPPGATPAEAVRGATTLDCLWRDPNADITFIEVAVGAVDPAVGTSYLDDLAADGYTCTDVHEGRRCHLTRPNADYPVDESFTRFQRDGVFISVDQANFSTNDLIGDIVDRLWG